MERIKERIILKSLVLIHEKIDLSHLCTCQLNTLAKVIEEIDPSNKETILSILYLESLIQGIIYTYDNENYWEYLKKNSVRKIVMVWHGSTETQFRMMLKIPEHVPSYDQQTLEKAVHTLAKETLIPWLNEYLIEYGAESMNLLKDGVQRDSDIKMLLIGFHF